MLIMSETINEIRGLLDKNCLDKAETLICDMIEAGAKSAELFYLKGQIYMKRQEWGNGGMQLMRLTKSWKSLLITQELKTKLKWQDQFWAFSIPI